MDSDFGSRRIQYPDAPREDHVDVLHGISVPDPYRWLEEIDSEETRRWIRAQNGVTEKVLGDHPIREKIRARLKELWNYERHGLPRKKGKHFFFSHNNGLQDQAVLYKVVDLAGPPQSLLDPNELSSDGTVALTAYAVSEDGRHLAYGLANSGSDWEEWGIRDVETGRDLDDRLQWIKFSQTAWTHDGEGFFYCAYDEPPEGTAYKGAHYYHKLYYHRLGTAQSEDRLVYHRPDQKEWGFGAEITEDGRYLVLIVWKGTQPENGIFYKDLQDEGGDFVELLCEFDARYTFIGNEGPVFYLLTNHEAEKSRVIAIDTGNPIPSAREEIIPEGQDRLQAVDLIGGRFVASYLRDAHSRLLLFETDGTFVDEIELPGIGTLNGIAGRKNDPEGFFHVSGFTMPGTVYRFDVSTGESSSLWKPRVDFSPEDYETSQVFFESADGTRVPMFLSHRRDLPHNGDTPVYLYGYGGFDIPMTPLFSVPNLAWMEMGGIYAQVCLRGGGEYGKGWHEGGTRHQKQNVFDDFKSAARWLVHEGYTRTPRLAIGGRSNGGLLTGACLTQDPELFGACITTVGVHDMLRFHKFTIGWAWVSDYGSPDDPDEFRTIHRYSPYHNVRKSDYPPTLVTTGDHDDRVFPAHSFKFASALQAAQTGTAPILIRIDTKAGHGGGKSTSKLIEESADCWTFLVFGLGMKDALG